MRFEQYRQPKPSCSMFQFSRRDAAALERLQSHPTNTDQMHSSAPEWAKQSWRDSSTKTIVHIHIAAACPFCNNYNIATHVCDLYGEPIPQREEASNPCKGNTFNRRLYSGNRLAQLRALRGK
jgi:hypothetical protein